MNEKQRFIPASESIDGKFPEIMDDKYGGEVDNTYIEPDSVLDMAGTEGEQEIRKAILKADEVMYSEMFYTPLFDLEGKEVFTLDVLKNRHIYYFGAQVVDFLNTFAKITIRNDVKYYTVNGVTLRGVESSDPSWGFTGEETADEIK